MQTQELPDQAFWEFLLKKFPDRLSLDPGKATDWRTDTISRPHEESVAFSGHIELTAGAEAVRNYFEPLGYNVTQQGITFYLAKDGNTVLLLTLAQETDSVLLLEVLSLVPA